MSALLDRDRVALANPDRVGQAAMGVVSGVQVRYSKEEQIMGIALALSLLVDKYGAHGGTILDAVDRLRGHFGYHPEVAAVKAYVENEL